MPLLNTPVIEVRSNLVLIVKFSTVLMPSDDNIYLYFVMPLLNTLVVFCLQATLVLELLSGSNCIFSIANKVTIVLTSVFRNHWNVLYSKVVLQEYQLLEHSQLTLQLL